MSDNARTIVRTVPHAILYSDETIFVKDVRLSFPHLRKPFKPGGKLSATFLMPKERDYRQAEQLLRDEIQRVVTQQLGRPGNPKPEIPDANKFLRDGDLLKDKPEYRSNWTINASESTPPFLRGLGRDPVTGGAEVIPEESVNRVFYPGCWVNTLIKPWFQDHPEGGKKVNANLIAVQFVRDDDSFGTGRISADEVDATLVPAGDSGYEDDDEL
jgi:hypothetical protein